MTRKPVVFLSALALATLGLAACGGGDEEGDAEATSSPAAASEEAPEETSDPQEQEKTFEEEGEFPSEEYSDEDTDAGAEDATDDEADAEPEEDDTDADSESATADPGPASEGAVIPSGAVSDPPAEIGEFELMDGSGPAHMYSHTEDSILISLDSNVLSSAYEDLVSEIETDNVAAGTGSCGTNGSGSSITCYQRTDDGVITLTAVPEEISVEGMAVFVNQYAEAAGAA